MGRLIWSKIFGLNNLAPNLSTPLEVVWAYEDFWTVVLKHSVVCYGTLSWLKGLLCQVPVLCEALLGKVRMHGASEKFWNDSELRPSKLLQCVSERCVDWVGETGKWVPWPALHTPPFTSQPAMNLSDRAPYQVARLSRDNRLQALQGKPGFFSAGIFSCEKEQLDVWVGGQEYKTQTQELLAEKPWNLFGGWCVSGKRQGFSAIKWEEWEIQVQSALSHALDLEHPQACYETTRPFMPSSSSGRAKVFTVTKECRHCTHAGVTCTSNVWTVWTVWTCTVGCFLKHS